jgi:hypothetical protein
MNPSTTDSRTSLIHKLGYQPEQAVLVVAAPQMFSDYLAQLNTKQVKQLPADWLQLFCTTKAELIGAIKTHTIDSVRVGIWLCWPKKRSGVHTDLSDQTSRDLLLPLGWVDTKVCAIDETWSGLKFVRRGNNNT